VAAFAYDQAVPLVDANIARVLARVFAVREAIDGAGLAQVWAYAERLQPARSGRAFNAGLMELGALICTPRAPKCVACPVERFCAAAASGAQEDFPVKKPRRRTARLAEPCALITRDGEVLLEHQSGSRWQGLWKLPALERIPEKRPDLVIEYPFTHHRVTLSVYRQKAPRSQKPGREWHAIAGLAGVPLAAAHRRALERLLEKRAG
jgi:A/G-specific adenine glycosylase